jgi:flagellar hook assembly protein FlgD
MTYVLDQNYPNPFNPTTQIRYGLPQQSQVQIRVFDLLGREVALLQDGEQQAGYHSVLWTGETSSGHSVASGIYFYRIDANSVNGRGFISMKKMMLLK